MEDKEFVEKMYYVMWANRSQLIWNGGSRKEGN